MKHKAYGKALLLGVFAIAGCYSYASDAINNENYHTVQASPNFIRQKVGDSDRVIVRLINDANNSAITTFSVGAVGAGIRVDSSCTVPNLDQAHQVAASCNGYYRPIFDAGSDTLVPNGPGDAQQFYVLGLATGQYTFTLTPTSVNSGVSRTVTVVITAADLGPALSKTTAIAGDTVVLTAPTGSVFSTTSAVTFATGVASIVGISADSTKLTLIVNGGITGPATVTNVGTAANPAVDVATLVTTNTLTTPGLFAGTLSNTSPAPGASVTLTAAANAVFSQTSAVTFAAGPAPAIVARSADSTTITFLVNAGDSGAATVTKVGVKNAPVLGTQTLTTSNSLNTVPAIPLTVSNLTPNIGVPITVALGASLRFLGNTHVFVGGVEAGIQAVSADSSTATIIPMAGSSGVITFTNVALNSLNTVLLAGPGDKSVTVGSTLGIPTDPNAAALATAPLISLRPTGSIVVTGGPVPSTNAGECAGATGDGCAIYQFVLTGPTTYDLSLIWQGGADMGLYRLNSAGGGATSQSGCDAGGQGPTGQPEVCTVTGLAAGTYYFTVQFFGTGSGYPPDANTVPPAWYQFRVTSH